MSEARRCLCPRRRERSLLCQRYVASGETRCYRHLAKHLGDWIGRHCPPEVLAKHRAALLAGRARWLARHQAAGLPYPAGRKVGALYWTPKTIAYHLRRWPNSLGWRIKAAQAGALPARYAVIDGADEALLWAAPNSRRWLW